MRLGKGRDSCSQQNGCLDTRRDFLITRAGVPMGRFPGSKAESGELRSWGQGVTHAPKAGILSLQKMFQCPYFFFDVVYIHNGADEKEEEMSWKVRGCCASGWQGGCRWGVSEATSVLHPWSPRPAESRI